MNKQIHRTYHGEAAKARAVIEAREKDKLKTNSFFGGTYDAEIGRPATSEDTIIGTKATSEAIKSGKKNMGLPWLYYFGLTFAGGLGIIILLMFIPF